MRTLFAFALVAGCAVPPAPPPPPARPVAVRPAVAPVVRPAPTSDEAPPASGVWTYVRDTRGSVAKFGTAGSDALFVVRCDDGVRRLSLSVPGRSPAALRLIASTGSTLIDTVPVSAAPPYVSANVATSAPILDALAFSRGRFAIDYGGARSSIPAWPEFARVIEDCRG